MAEIMRQYEDVRNDNNPAFTANIRKSLLSVIQRVRELIWLEVSNTKATHIDAM